MAMQCNGKELLLQMRWCGLRSSMVRDSLRNGVDSIDKIPLLVAAQTAVEEESGVGKRTAAFGLGTFLLAFYSFGPAGALIVIIIELIVDFPHEQGAL